MELLKIVIADDIEINKLYVTLWLEENKHTWYTGHCLSKNDNGTHKIEHLPETEKFRIFRYCGYEY